VAISKHEAALAFQRHGLEGLPARVIAGARELVDLSGGDFSQVSAVTVRACGPGEDKNLPRLVSVSLADACDWVASTPHPCFIVQPYDELVFSLELVVTPDQLFAELVPGIWELDNRFAPGTLRLRQGDDAVEVALPLEPQQAKFWNPQLGAPEWEPRLVEGWQIAVTVDWLAAHSEALRQLATELGFPLGIKAHYSRCYGISPQNIHTKNVVGPTADDHIGAPNGTPVVTDSGAPVPVADAVTLLAPIAREDHDDLSRLIDRLHVGGVRRVYLQSGMLSHLAITLRERGFEVKRA
jgi:hypothetical protein